jgi:orotate phosphoribosyltransferase
MPSLSLADFSACGAHQKGHFRLSSGMHSADYIQCALFLSDPRRAAQAGQMLATLIKAHLIPPSVVISPAIGGLVIGHETARALTRAFIFTERDAKGRMALRRQFAITANRGVVVVEDVVTTGGSTREVIKIVEKHGAQPIGVVSIINRSGQENPFDPTPFYSLVKADLPVWPADQCPLCQRGVSLSTPGSRQIG